MCYVHGECDVSKLPYIQNLHDGTLPPRTGARHRGAEEGGKEAREEGKKGGGHGVGGQKEAAKKTVKKSAKKKAKKKMEDPDDYDDENEDPYADYGLNTKRHARQRERKRKKTVEAKNKKSSAAQIRSTPQLDVPQKETYTAPAYRAEDRPSALAENDKDGSKSGGGGDDEEEEEDDEADGADESHKETSVPAAPLHGEPSDIFYDELDWAPETAVAAKKKAVELKAEELGRGGVFGGARGQKVTGAERAGTFGRLGQYAKYLGGDMLKSSKRTLGRFNRWKEKRAKVREQSEAFNKEVDAETQDPALSMAKERKRNYR